MTYDNLNLNYVGFWKENRGSYENRMPWEIDWKDIPVVDSATEDQSIIIAQIKTIQSTANFKNYLGASNCRICGIQNGSSEYIKDGFCWPSGYIHYLRDHNVACNIKFKKYVQSQNIDSI